MGPDGGHCRLQHGPDQQRNEGLSGHCGEPQPANHSKRTMSPASVVPAIRRLTQLSLLGACKPGKARKIAAWTQKVSTT